MYGGCSINQITMNKLKALINNWVRKNFWPNYVFAGEQRLDDGRIMYKIEDLADPKHPYEKMLIQNERKDLTPTGWFTKNYNIDRVQVAGDWVFMNIKLFSGKIVKVKITAATEDPKEAFLTDPERMELLQIINDIKLT